MAESPIFSLFLPIALGIVMIGLGLHLTLDDFRRVLRAPKAVTLALLIQSVLLPPVAFGLAMGLGLPPELGLGLMLLAASPGGVTANLFSHLARGDVALNISLTAINSALALVTLPLWTAAGLAWLMEAERSIPPPTQKIVEVGVLVLLPVVIGMTLRARAPGLAARLTSRLLKTLGPERSCIYRACGYGGGQARADENMLCGDENAILDYRFTPTPKVTWFFDHHRTAFPCRDDLVGKVLGKNDDGIRTDHLVQSNPDSLFH